MLKSSMSQMLIALAAGLFGGDKIRAAQKQKRFRPLPPKNPNDPYQAALMLAAHAKRQRKRAKLDRDTFRSHVCQHAHNVWPTKIGENRRPGGARLAEPAVREPRLMNGPAHSPLQGAYALHAHRLPEALQGSRSNGYLLP